MALGTAEGFFKQQGLDIQSRQVGLSEQRNEILARQQKMAEQAAITQQASERVNKTLEVANQIFTNTQAAGGDTTKAMAAIREMAGTLQPLVDRGLVDGAMLQARIDAIATQPSPMQIAENEAIASATKKLREEEAKIIAEEEAVSRGLGTTKSKDVVAEGLSPGTPEFQARIKELNDKVQSEVNVEIGGSSELTKTSKTKTQESIIGLSSQLSELSAIAENFSGEFLTFVGAGRAKLGRFLDKAGIAGEDTKEFLGKRRSFTQAVNQIFNQYRREITGAAASVQELTSLKEAVISEDLSPAEFDAAFAQFQDQILRGLELKRELLADGIDLNDPRFGSEFDRRLLGVESEAESVDVTNLSDDEITKRLRKMGIK